MYLSVKEMLLICAFHQGTLSRTLDTLRKAKDDDPMRMALVKSVTEKLWVFLKTCGYPVKRAQRPHRE